jgi:hypothetical protein
MENLDKKNIITIQYHSDEESFEVQLNGEYLKSYNHDQHGWEGMDVAKELVFSLAAKLGIIVEETYASEDE